MKKVLLFIICAICAAAALAPVGCGLLSDSRIPPGYIAADEHRDPQATQDHTDYCVYYYDSDESIKTHPDYALLSGSDKDRVAGYFSDFEQWMEVQGRLDEYSFDADCISDGDYWSVKTLEGQPISGSAYGKYDNYTVWFFDSETHTLYYIHSNI